MQGTLDRPSFGKLLREFRLAAGLSQGALAERAAMSADGVSALERGVNRAPQRETLTLLVDALRLEPEQRKAIEAAVCRPNRPRGPVARGTRRYNLPRSPWPLIGREQELSVLEALVTTARVLTLVGAGGVGKTRLAIEIGHVRLCHCEDVWFIDLAAIRDSNGVAAAIGETLGVRERSARTFLDAIVETLEQKNALLIFDNCEHVIEAAVAAVERISAECAKVRILATSRQPLQVAGEQIYRVASLTLPASVALFMESAKRTDTAFRLEHDERPIVERICRQLDGIALAIELAAARLRLLSLPQIEALLSERFVVLSGRGRPTRHQTMRAVVDWSHDLLSAQERQLFASLGVFPAEFSLEAVLAICAASSADAQLLDVLGSLVDKSLLTSERHGRARRFRLLETMRAYALEKLGEDIATLKRRHAEYYLQFIEATDFHAPNWPDVVEADFDNLRRALEWSIDELGDPALGVRLLTSIRPYLWLRGLGSEYTRRAEQALMGRDALPLSLQAAALETVVALRGELLTSDKIVEDVSRAMDLYARLDDLPGVARTLRARGRVYLRLGMHPQAESDLRRSLELSKSVGDEWEIIRTLAALATAFQRTSRFEESRKTNLEVLERARRLGDEQMVEASSLNLAENEFAAGEIDSAAKRLEEVLASKMARKSVRFRAHVESNLAAYLLALHRDEEAHSMARAAILDARQAADRGIMAYALGHMATVLSRSDPRTAARLLGYVEHLFGDRYTREATERYTYELLMIALRRSLSDPEIVALQRDGENLSEAQAVRTATHMKCPPPVPPL